MTAMHLAWRSRYAWVALILIQASSLMLGGAAMAQEEPITAVYKARELSFQYRLTNRFRGCHNLEKRVANILVGVGARDDIDVRVNNCEGYLTPEDPFEDPVFGRDDPTRRDRWNPSSSTFRRSGADRTQSASVRVQLMMPVEVTPQVLAEIDKDKSRRELVSRVTGNPAAAFNDPVVFAAQRQEVTLSQKTIRLQPEDCDLLEQMTQQVFRQLNVRVVRRGFSCGREASSIAPQVVVEALLPTGELRPLPEPEKKKEAGPGASQDPAALPEPP